MSTYPVSGGTDMDTTIDDIDTGRHPVNTGHLVMGLVFLGLVGVWALVDGDVVADDDVRWLLPIPWVGGGLIGLAVATWANMRSRNQRSAVSAEPVAERFAGTAAEPPADEPFAHSAEEPTTYDDLLAEVDTETTRPLDDTETTRRLDDDGDDPTDTDPTEENR